MPICSKHLSFDIDNDFAQMLKRPQLAGMPRLVAPATSAQRPCFSSYPLFLHIFRLHIPAARFFPSIFTEEMSREQVEACTAVVSNFPAALPPGQRDPMLEPFVSLGGLVV